MAFGYEQDFEHHGNPFVYQPAPDQPWPNIVGQIGRPFTRLENLPPEQGFALAPHQAWRAAVIALDPTPHEDGQKLSFSIDPQVGTPYAVLRSLIRQLNQVNDPPYHIEAEPIFSPKTFWAFADEHKGEITSIRFEFVTPNMFGSSDALSEELREFRHDERAQVVRVNLHSEDGLNTDTPRVRASVDYAGKGAGKILAFAKGRKRYNSEDQVETVGLEETEEPLLIRALRHIYAVLGR